MSPNVKGLKDRTREVWHIFLPPEAIKKTCWAIQERLRKRIGAKGKYFHRLIRHSNNF